MAEVARARHARSSGGVWERGQVILHGVAEVVTVHERVGRPEPERPIEQEMPEPAEVRRLGEAQTTEREQTDLPPRVGVERRECGATCFRFDRRAGLLDDALAGL